jgi:hypothetical protein
MVAAMTGIKEAVVGREAEILHKLGIRWRDGHPHIRCPYLAHVDKNPSWRWDPEKRAAFCTCTDKPVSIFDIIMRVEVVDFGRAANHAAEIIGRPDLIRGGRPKTEPRHDDAKPAGCALAEYAAAKGLPEDFLRDLGLVDTTYARAPAIKIPYRATGGTEVAVRYRVALDGADKFRWSKGSKAIPYGLDRLGEAREAGYVVLVEGESDSQTLWHHGFPALGLPGATTWHEDRDAPLLDGLTTVYVVIEPDKGGTAVLKWLRRSSIVSRVRLVRLKEAKDASVLHLRHSEGFHAAFRRALDEAEPYRPPADPKAVAAAKSGRQLDLHEPEPWPDPINGARLLDEMVAAIRRYVVLDETGVRSVALWALGTHVFDSFNIFPRLVATSPEKRCGKSTLLDAIERLVPRPLPAANISAAALFRVIEAAQPTLILDEADTFARDNEELRGVLNAGHKRNGMVVRIVEAGGDYKPMQFSVWAPVALAAIGHLPGTVEDRSLIVRLKRRRPDEKVESLRLDRPNGLDQLARKAARWAVDHPELRDADPAIPPAIINRDADNWRPLLAIADLAGGDWPARARQAASELVGEHADDSRRVQLLADIRAAFETKGADRLSSDDLVTCLTSLDDRPWVEFSKGRALSKPQLARLLRPVGVSSGTIRLDGERTAKGYYLCSFEDAFARYLPSPPFSNCHTVTTQTQPSVFADFKTSHKKACDVSESPGDPSVSAPCDGVTVSNPRDREDRERAAHRVRIKL